MFTEVNIFYSFSSDKSILIPVVVSKFFAIPLTSSGVKRSFSLQSWIIVLKYF